MTWAQWRLQGWRVQKVPGRKVSFQLFTPFPSWPMRGWGLWSPQPRGRHKGPWAPPAQSRSTAWTNLVFATPRALAPFGIPWTEVSFSHISGQSSNASFSKEPSQIAQTLFGVWFSPCDVFYYGSLWACLTSSPKCGLLEPGTVTRSSSRGQWGGQKALGSSSVCRSVVLDEVHGFSGLQFSLLLTRKVGIKASRACTLPTVRADINIDV